MVEERLVEAWGFLMRMPDREAGWMRIGSGWPLAQVVREWNDYWQTDDKPVRLGLRSYEVDRMNEALGWVEGVRERDRKLVGLALHALHRQVGTGGVPWGGLKRAIGWGGHPDALRRRYGRALAGIAGRLNSALGASEMADFRGDGASSAMVHGA